MGRLDIRLEKNNLGDDVEFGVVADVLQVRDVKGKFPQAPFEQEVVIPAGQTLRREVPVPPGTYRIEARLPSGEVMSEVREVPDDDTAEVAVVFKPERSPHEWLSWQRLAGNVPSEKDYEEFLTRLARQISAAAARRDGTRIDVSPTVIGWAARELHKLQLRVMSMFRKAGSANIEATANGSPPASDAAPTAAPAEPADFELVGGKPADSSIWESLSSIAAWSAWRRSATAYAGCSLEREDDREITLWRITQLDGAIGMIDTPAGQAPMRCLAISRRGQGVDVMFLPVPWPLNPAQARPQIEILREAGPSNSGRTTVVVRDTRLGGLLMYLNSSKIGKAATVLAAADQAGLIDSLLVEGHENPIAACSAAYVAIAGLKSPDADRWHRWFDRLQQYPWLPDGAVIKATYLLKTARSNTDLALALASLKAAYGAGVPFFVAGVQHLQQGLYAFSETDTEAAQMHKAIADVALRVDPDQVFTLVNVPAPRPAG
jgi:hypothetical protein